MKKPIVAVAAALALLVPVSGATASETESPVNPCPPGTFGVTVYYRHPQGWVTIDIPLCFKVNH